MGERGAHQQAAVGASANGELRRRSVFVGDEVLSCREKIVEHILFLLKHARLVPGFAVLATAAQIWLRVETALFHPPRVLGIPVSRLRKQEAAICVHQGRHASVLFESFL